MRQSKFAVIKQFVIGTRKRAIISAVIAVLIIGLSFWLLVPSNEESSTAANSSRSTERTEKASGESLQDTAKQLESAEKGFIEENKSDVSDLESMVR